MTAVMRNLRRGPRLRQGSTLVLLAALLVGSALPLDAEAQDCAATIITETGKIPLPDLGLGTYLGFTGGLYPEGRSIRPAEHLAAGVEIARQVRPLDRQGAADDRDGKIVMISIGMSNTNMMFAGSGGPENRLVSFMARIEKDPSINPQLEVVNGAQGGEVSEDWIDADAPAWANLESYLAEAGVTADQVQVAWVKLATRDSKGPFPEGAVVRQGYFEAVARNLQTRFPNIKLAYFSTRTFSVAEVPKSSEPITYEDGLAVKWMMESQIEGDPGLNYDPRRGRVNAPWLSWGPYLWTDGVNPRSDGLIWTTEDQGCGAHPSTNGVAKNAAQLYAFFTTDPTSTPWFLRSTVVGQPPQDVIATASPAHGDAPLTVQFHATASDGDGQIRSIVWTFGDGTFSYNRRADPAAPFDIQNNADPQKTYFMPGSYEAYATVTDDAGNTVLKTVSVTVTGEPVIRHYEPGQGGGTQEPTSRPGSTQMVDPVGLSATAESTGQILLEWSGDAIDPRGFMIERSADGETGWESIKTVGPDIRTYLDSQLQPSTVYFYRLQLAGSGDGVFSAEVSAVTEAAPTEGQAVGQVESPTPETVAGRQGAEGEGDVPAGVAAPAPNVGALLMAFAAGSLLALTAGWVVSRRRPKDV